MVGEGGSEKVRNEKVVCFGECVCVLERCSSGLTDTLVQVLLGGKPLRLEETLDSYRGEGIAG